MTEIAMNGVAAFMDAKIAGQAGTKIPLPQLDEATAAEEKRISEISAFWQHKSSGSIYRFTGIIWISLSTAHGGVIIPNVQYSPKDQDNVDFGRTYDDFFLKFRPVKREDAWVEVF